MPTFIVSTAILSPSQEPQTCAIGAPKKLMDAGIRNVTLRSCYCCSEYESVVFVVDGANRESALKAFRQINVPVASILEAEEIKLPA